MEEKKMRELNKDEQEQVSGGVLITDQDAEDAIFWLYDNPAYLEEVKRRKRYEGLDSANAYLTELMVTNNLPQEWRNWISYIIRILPVQ